MLIGTPEIVFSGNLMYGKSRSRLNQGRTTRAFAEQSGQVLIGLALAMVMIMAGAGISADVGNLERQKQRMQAAADAAAIAGASALLTQAETAADAGANDASLNGFTSGTGTTVTINNPPLSGDFTSNSQYVEAIIDQPQPTWFLSLLGYSTIDVSARAVAGAANASGCVYVLDSSGSGAITANGNASLSSECGILDDSSSSTALIANGNVQISASAIGVAGSTLINGGATLTPTPVTGIVPVSDPLSSVPAPYVGSCQYNYEIVNGNQSVTLSPGVYCGGIILNGGANVTFSSGTYILCGGMIANGGVTMNGTGVTFYNTSGTSCGSYGPIIFNGNVTANLSAPTSGSLKGILFFQDRTITNGAGSIINGGVNAEFSGALYFPSTSLTYNGGSDAAYTIIVAKDLTINGTATMNDDYSSLSGGSPIQNATLAE